MSANRQSLAFSDDEAQGGSDALLGQATVPLAGVLSQGRDICYVREGALCRDFKHCAHVMICLSYDRVRATGCCWISGRSLHQ